MDWTLTVLDQNGKPVTISWDFAITPQLTPVLWPVTINSVNTCQVDATCTITSTNGTILEKGYIFHFLSNFDLTTPWVLKKIDLLNDANSEIKTKEKTPYLWAIIQIVDNTHYDLSIIADNYTRNTATWWWTRYIRAYAINENWIWYSSVQQFTFTDHNIDSGLIMHATCDTATSSIIDQKSNFTFNIASWTYQTLDFKWNSWMYGINASSSSAYMSITDINSLRILHNAWSLSWTIRFGLITWWALSRERFSVLFSFSDASQATDKSTITIWYNKDWLLWIVYQTNTWSELFYNDPFWWGYADQNQAYLHIPFTIIYSPTSPRLLIYFNGKFAVRGTSPNISSSWYTVNNKLFWAAIRNTWWVVNGRHIHSLWPIFVHNRAITQEEIMKIWMWWIWMRVAEIELMFKNTSQFTIQTVSPRRVEDDAVWWIEYRRTDTPWSKTKKSVGILFFIDHYLQKAVFNITGLSSWVAYTMRTYKTYPAPVWEIYGNEFEFTTS